MRQLTNQEVDQAMMALIEWFKSQEIMPGDAGIIMAKLVATQLVLKTRDVSQLTRAIDLHHDLLTCEVASYLNG